MLGEITSALGAKSIDVRGIHAYTDQGRGVVCVVVDKLAPRLAPDLPIVAGDESIEVERSAFISALWTLPARQREVVVLRYFADLPETQVALATGISEGAVKVHAARAMSSLRTELRKAGPPRA